MFRNLPAGRTWSAGLFLLFFPEVRMHLMLHGDVPRIGFVLRTRVMCQAGRARAASARHRSAVVSWLCERAPLWVVVHVCALLREA